MERMAPTILYLHAILWMWAGCAGLGSQAAERKASWNRLTKNLSMGDIIEIARERHIAEIIKSIEPDGSKWKKYVRILSPMLCAA